MKLLAEITDKTLGIEPAEEILERDFKLRKSARAIIFNDKNEIAMQFVSKQDYYKLPGGGVELGETIEDALHREVLEEVGCKVKIEQEVGCTIEYRTQQDLLHISYAYICRLSGEIGEPSYEQGEIDDGFETVWTTLDEAIELVSSKPEFTNLYQAPFIVLRERAFLVEAINVLKNKS